MFTHLLRRLADTIDRARVSFLSEPVALAAPNLAQRKVVQYDLETWLKLDDKNGDDDAIAGFYQYEGGTEMAVVVTARSSDVIVIDLRGARAKFIDDFLSEAKATRGLITGTREARINPPPPPPPPTRPPIELVGRIDALLRIGGLPVIKFDDVTRAGPIG